MTIASWIFHHWQLPGSSNKQQQKVKKKQRHITEFSWCCSVILSDAFPHPMGSCHPVVDVLLWYMACALRGVLQRHCLPRALFYWRVNLFYNIPEFCPRMLECCHVDRKGVIKVNWVLIENKINVYKIRNKW